MNLEPTKHRFWGTVAIIFLIILAYLPAFSSGFVWDDDYWVYGNPVVKGDKDIRLVWYTAAVPGQNYPLTYTFFWAQYRLWGANPFGFHLSNVLIHILNVLLLWSILKRLEVKGSWFAALVFGLHPLVVESVAWITEAKNVLSAFFLFSSFLLFLSEKPGPKSRCFFSILLYLLALLSKTFVCTFPVILLIVGWYRRGRVSLNLLKRVFPYFALSLLAGAFTWFYEIKHVGVGGERWELPLIVRFLLAGRAACFYLSKFFFPLKLTFIYPRWEIDPASLTAWLYPLLVVILFVAFWKIRRLSRGPLAALACYIVFLLPALGFISFYAQVYSYVADHYAYLAIIGPVAFLVSVVASIPSVRIKTVLAGAVLIALLVLTFFQTMVYRELETLWRDTIRKNPRAGMAHNNLGVLLFNRGEAEGAMEYYRRAIEINPENAYAYNNLGMALTEAGRWEEALPCYAKALSIRSDNAGFYFGLGAALKEGGRLEEAIANYRRALEIYPGMVDAYTNLGLILTDLGRLEEAVELYREALRIVPGSPEAHNNLGLALAAQGKIDEAIGEYKEALRLDPGLEGANWNLVNALAGRGRLDEACRFYRELVESDPDNAKAHYNLAVALGKQGENEKAGRHYLEALRLNPEYAEAHLNLGGLLYDEGKLEEAMEHYRRALSADPGYVKAHFNLAIILLGRGERNEALQHLEKAVELRPDFEPARKALDKLKED